MAISSLGVPNTSFIYTNPAAAQQAAQDLRDRLLYDNERTRLQNEYASRLGETIGANTRAQAQASAAQALRGAELKAAAVEGEANRASAERIASSGETARLKQVARNKYIRDMEVWGIASKIAESQNANPSAKVPQGYTYRGTDGLFHPMVERPIDPDAVVAVPSEPGASASPKFKQPSVGVPAEAPKGSRSSSYPGRSSGGVSMSQRGGGVLSAPAVPQVLPIPYAHSGDWQGPTMALPRDEAPAGYRDPYDYSWAIPRTMLGPGWPGHPMSNEIQGPPMPQAPQEWLYDNNDYGPMVPGAARRAMRPVLDPRVPLSPFELDPGY